VPPEIRPRGADGQDPKNWIALGTISEKEEIETEGTPKFSAMQSANRRDNSKKKKDALKPPLPRRKKKS
jgi:hypothetical protein